MNTPTWKIITERDGVTSPAQLTLQILISPLSPLAAPTHVSSTSQSAQPSLVPSRVSLSHPFTPSQQSFAPLNGLVDGSFTFRLNCDVQMRSFFGVLLNGLQICILSPSSKGNTSVIVNIYMFLPQQYDRFGLGSRYTNVSPSVTQHFNLNIDPN